jgi:hypothetical protein
MSLLELFDKEIYLFFPSDVFAVLNLITTSKTVKNAILHIRPKVNVKLDNRLSIEFLSFSNIIQKLSKMFTIDKLNLKNLKIQKNIITVYPKNTFEISYFDVIFNYCKSLRELSVTCYSDEDILIKFIQKMPNCKVLYFFETLDYNYRPSRLEIPDYIPNEYYPTTKLRQLDLNYSPNNYNLEYIAPEKIILKNIDNIKRVKKLNLNAQRSNNKFNNKSWFNKR